MYQQGHRQDFERGSFSPISWTFTVNFKAFSLAMPMIGWQKTALNFNT
jgi:hypothetical protein